jgi:hypothetical protein
MHMNIYISKENERFLRQYSGSMSGLINELLGDYFEKTKKTIHVPQVPGEYTPVPDKPEGPWSGPLPRRKGKI